MTERREYERAECSSSKGRERDGQIKKKNEDSVTRTLVSEVDRVAELAGSCAVIPVLYAKLAANLAVCQDGSEQKAPRGAGVMRRPEQTARPTA